MLLPCPRAKVFLIPKVSAIKVIQILTLKTNVTDKCDKEVSENLEPCRKLPGMQELYEWRQSNWNFGIDLEYL